MPSKKRRISQPEVVRLFAERLREMRHSRGKTQEALAHEAGITPSYVWRLESGGASPGIDLVDRLAKALSCTMSDLLPTTHSPDTLNSLREHAHRQFASLMEVADREFLLMFNSLLFRLSDSVTKGR